MRSVFENDLQEIYHQLTSLGNAANESLLKAINAYKTQDKELAHELFSDDLRINAATADIEKQAYRIILLQQPVAGDLRLLFTVLHSSLDVERIADHAVSIARATMRLDNHFVLDEDSNEIINQMANLAQEMLTGAIVAFMNQDAKAAKKIAAIDEEIDGLLKKLFNNTIEKMQSSPDLVNSGVSYIGVGRSLERIGDYVTNICERIVFLTTGEIIELN